LTAALSFEELFASGFAGKGGGVLLLLPTLANSKPDVHQCIRMLNEICALRFMNHYSLLFPSGLHMLQLPMMKMQCSKKLYPFYLF
ncbi:hypothetical protein T10_9624, partial [Trichinella papuae]